MDKRSALQEKENSTQTHTISRAFELMRNIARDGAGGARLIDLAQRTGIPHPSARRILKMLIAERMVLQSAATNRYRLGPLSYELGLASGYANDLALLVRPQLEVLAKATKGTIYLLCLSGNDAVCLDRIEGTHAMRPVLLRIGARRPLGAGPTGIALLANMPEEEVEQLLQVNEIALKHIGAPHISIIRRAVQETRLRGYAITRNWPLADLGGIGMAVPAHRNIFLSISVSVPTTRMTDRWLEDTVALFRLELAKIDVDGAFIHLI